MRIRFLLLGLIVWANSAQAEPTLMGRDVTLSVQTYNDPADMIFRGADHRSKVVEGLEFGLGREGVQNDIDVVPILIDISAERVEISYSIADPSELMKARFNGYVLTFGPGCGQITKGRVDTEFTNIQFDDKRVSVRDGVLMLNVSTLTTDQSSRLAVDLTLSDC